MQGTWSPPGAILLDPPKPLWYALCALLRQRWRAGNHHAQLSVGDGAVIVTGQRVGDGPEAADAAAITIVGGVGGVLSTGHAASAEYEYGKQITICHRTGSDTNPTVTIIVSESSLDAHLKHGDTIGPCP